MKRSWWLVSLLAALAGCSSPAAYPGVMVKEASVGSVFTPWTSPRKTTWVCRAKDGLQVAEASASGGSSETREASATIAAKLKDWVSAKGGYSSVERITVTLTDGKIQQAALQDALVKFQDQPSNCQDAIRAQEQGGAKYFTIATKVYTGTIVAKVELNKSVSAAASSEALQRLSADLSADGKSVTSTEFELKVAGGVWILETEPYNVPAPGAAN